MTNKEAVKTLKANYPDACFEQLREAVDAAIEALKAQDAAGDTISRSAALDALRTCYDTETVTMSNGDEYINYEDAVGEIEQLQPAQPEIIQCKNCKHWRRMTTSAGTSFIYGFCESDAMWMSLSGETTEVSHIDTYNDFHCGYAERRTDDRIQGI